MKKRLFAIMLALAMLLAAVPALAEEGEVQEQDQVKEKILCATEGCKNEVANKGDFCKDCATAKKVAEEAAKKAAEEEAARKAAEEEAAKKVAEEAARKAAEEQKITEEENAKKSQMLLGEANPAGAETANGCNHEHTTGWGGTMVEHPAKDPTCTSEGNIKFYTCTKCGRYFLRDESIKEKIVVAKETSAEEVKISKKDHTPTQIAAKAATCTEAGNIEYYECSVCKGKFADSTGMHPIENIVIPALGHTMSEDVTYPQKPTCTNAGKATYTCGRCGAKQENVNVPALGHDYGDPTWNWCGVSSATATFKCKREGCDESKTLPATVTTSNEYGNCYVYTRHTAKVTGPDGNDYYDSKTTNCRRPDWYYDPCYYNNPCGHWGCGNVCTRYSDCVPCRDYRTTFRVGGYNCLATPKTGDVSVIGMALISLAGAGAAIMGKKRK